MGRFAATCRCHSCYSDSFSYKSCLARRGNSKYPEICKWLGVDCREVPALLAIDRLWKLPLVFIVATYLRLNRIRASICIRCKNFRHVFNLVAAVVINGYKIIDSFRFNIPPL